MDSIRDKTIDDVWQALPGPAAIARGIGEKPSTIGEMKRRGNIPVPHWLRLIAFAKQFTKARWIDCEALVWIHTPHDKRVLENGER